MKRSCIVTALWGTYAVSQIYIAALLYPLGRDVLRLQLTSEPLEIRRVLSAWTTEQRDQYRRHLLPDTLHPLLYSSALIATGLVGPGRYSASRWGRCAAVSTPVAAAGCDLVENMLHSRFLDDPGGITPNEAQISVWVTRAKWVLACGAVVGLLSRGRRKEWSGA